jgi:hypothetical protein
VENISSLAAARALSQIEKNPELAVPVTEELMLNPHTVHQADTIRQRLGEKAASMYISLAEIIQSGEELPVDEDIKLQLREMITERSVLNLLLIKREDPSITREELEATERMMNRIIGSIVLHAHAKNAYRRKYPTLNYE